MIGDNIKKEISFELWKRIKTYFEEEESDKNFQVLCEIYMEMLGGMPGMMTEGGWGAKPRLGQ